MHAHHLAALVAELSGPDYAGLDADAAFLRASHPGRLASRLGTVRFLTQAQLDAMSAKRRPERFIVISEDVVAAFPSGVPGFPNKLCREWFNSAWAEARPVTRQAV